MFVVELTGLRHILTGIYKIGNGCMEHAAAWSGVALCASAIYAVPST